MDGRRKRPLGMERTMTRILVGAFFWIAALAFTTAAQAGPFDLTDDLYVTQSQ